ncbi:Protein kinase C, brain isozyme [Gryllus bimaculatus]|nr:Protein kinase C, brain isozyme [Gryllus bimaculatus]
MQKGTQALLETCVALTAKARLSSYNISQDKVHDISVSEEQISPLTVLQSPDSSSTPSPVVGDAIPIKPASVISSVDWPPEDDIDRYVGIHHQRSSLSSLGPRSDSLASVYSGAGEGRYGTVAVRGEVEFALQYNYKAGALEIHVKQCRDLAPVDVKRNRSDPYVKVYLLPDKSKSGKRKTKVKKHTLNPVFDETLKFHMTLHGLETRTLWLTVWHSDMFGRNDFLGEVMMSLENKVFDDPTPHWYPLQERTEPFDDVLSYKGDVIIGLKFVPPDVTVMKKGKRSRGALHVLVKEAKNLVAVKANGSSDPFCKSYLLPDKGRSSKQKTPVIRRTCSPVWNHSFVYEDVSLQELSERSLELTVWDHDRLASNEFLGGVRFNLGTGKHYGKCVDWMDATGKEMTLWQSMLERPNFWVEGCLALRPTLEHRTSQ